MANFRLYFLTFTDTASKTFEFANQVDFFNQGTNDAWINGRLIEPGVGFSMQSFPSDIDVTSYEIMFTANNIAGNKVVVTVKQYV